MADASSSYGAAEPGAAAAVVPKSWSAPYVAEFLGTFVVVFTVGCCLLSPGSVTWNAAAIGCVLMVMTYGTSPISGGNLNPAVSLTLGLIGNLRWQVMVKYWAVQFSAGVAASWCCCSLFNPRTGAVEPVAPFTWGYALVAEVVYTFMLCFVFGSCSASARNNPKDDNNQFFALAVGFAAIAGGYAASAVSGACFNPAVSFGLSSTGFGLRWGLLWVLGEVIGALLAAIAFRVLRPEEYNPPGGPGGHLSFGAEWRPQLHVRCASEFLGALLLVLTVTLNLTTASLSTPFSYAAVLICMSYALGDVSGGYFNPSVTLAVVLAAREKCSPRDGALYVAAQLLGALCAACVSAAFHAAGPNAEGTFGLAPGPGYGPNAAGLLELFFTFVLCYVVLSCQTCAAPSSWRTRQNFYFAFAAGSCVLAAGFAIGAVSGSELNPALSLGLATEGLVHHGTRLPPPLSSCFTFSLWELTGGLLSAIVFSFTHPDEYRKAPLLAK